MCMRICAYTLCARMLISMYKLAGLFFLLLIVDCSFNDPTLRHLKVHGRMNKSCRAKESLHDCLLLQKILNALRYVSERLLDSLRKNLL